MDPMEMDEKKVPEADQDLSTHTGVEIHSKFGDVINKLVEFERVSGTCKLGNEPVEFTVRTFCIFPNARRACSVWQFYWPALL